MHESDGRSEEAASARVRIGQAFAERMYRLRVGAGLSQREVAERLRAKGWRVDPSAVTRIEGGQRPVRIDEAVLIAQVLGSSVSALVGEPDEGQDLAEFVLGSLDWQGRHYGEVVEAAKSLYRLRYEAYVRLSRDAERSAGDQAGEELRARLEAFMHLHTPLVAVFEAEYMAMGPQPPYDIEERRTVWRNLQTVTEQVRLALADQLEDAELPTSQQWQQLLDVLDQVKPADGDDDGQHPEA